MTSKNPGNNRPSTQRTRKLTAAAAIAADERRKGGRGFHLTLVAVNKVIAAIVAGEGNTAINRMLVRDKHLKEGHELSRQSLAIYRNDPRARVQIDRLTEEAIQVAHVALSDSLVQAAVSMRSAFAKLFDDAGNDANLGSRDRNALVNQWYKGLNTLWDRVGRDDLLQTVLRTQAAMLEEVDKVAGISAEDRKSIEIGIKRQIAEMMRKVLRPQTAIDNEVRDALTEAAGTE